MKIGRAGAGASRRNFLAGIAPATLVIGGWLASTMRALAQTVLPAAREIPAHPLPVPETVSEALRPVVSAPLSAGWNSVPDSIDAWRSFSRASGRGAATVLAEIRRKLRVKLESDTLGGVPVLVSTPEDMPAANRDRVLVHLHGGGYVLYPGEVDAGEGMMMAGYGRFRVVSVDFRLAPDFPFPAALDDSLAVWKTLLARTDAAKMAMFGTSSGAGLTLATLLRARAEKLPLPAAIAPGSPWADLTMRGDSAFANAFVDNVLVARDGWAGGAAMIYAAGHDLRDPLISPLYGDFTGFPPAILTSGTRDLLLSDTVRVHRKLRQAGVEAVLQLFEAQSHAQFLKPFAPETEEAFAEIAGFFDRHLRGMQ